MSREQRELLSWVGAVLVAGGTVVGSLFFTFQTKAEARKTDEAIERVEHKLDALLIQQGIDLRQFTEGE